MKNFKFLILMLLTLVNIQSIYSQISVPYGDDAIGDNNNPNLEEFVVHGNDWDCRYLTYTFVNGTGDIAGVQEEDAVRRAMASWSAVANINFIEVCNEVDADLEERVALEKALENSSANNPELLIEKIDGQIDEIRKELKKLKRRL